MKTTMTTQPTIKPKAKKLTKEELLALEARMTIDPDAISPAQQAIRNYLISIRVKDDTTK